MDPKGLHQLLTVTDRMKMFLPVVTQHILCLHFESTNAGLWDSPLGTWGTQCWPGFLKPGLPRENMSGSGQCPGLPGQLSSEAAQLSELLGA
jgi:hypothetical protein